MLEYRQTSSGCREKVVMTRCPLCGLPLSPRSPDRANHLWADHGPEDAGLSPLGTTRSPTPSPSGGATGRVAADGGGIEQAVSTVVVDTPDLSSADPDLGDDLPDASEFSTAAFYGAFRKGVCTRHYAVGLDANPYDWPGDCDNPGWKGVFARRWEDGWRWEDDRVDGDWGIAFERRVCLDRPFTHEGGDAGERWFDLEVQQSLTLAIGPRLASAALVALDAGDRIECKVARVRVEDDETTRHGRFWIQRSNHERLLDADGTYCLGVYDDRHGLRRIAYVDATVVDSLATWSSSGPNHPTDENGKLRWPKVFGEASLGSSRPTGGASA